MARLPSPGCHTLSPMHPPVGKGNWLLSYEEMQAGTENCSSIHYQDLPIYKITIFSKTSASYTQWCITSHLIKGFLQHLDTTQQSSLRSAFEDSSETRLGIMEDVKDVLEANYFSFDCSPLLAVFSIILVKTLETLFFLEVIEK